jgi:hypothetical protein
MVKDPIWKLSRPGPIFRNPERGALDRTVTYQRETKEVLKLAGMCWQGWQGLASNLNRLGVDDS